MRWFLTESKTNHLVVKHRVLKGKFCKIFLTLLSFGLSVADMHCTWIHFAHHYGGVTAWPALADLQSCLCIAAPSAQKSGPMLLSPIGASNARTAASSCAGMTSCGSSTPRANTCAYAACAMAAQSGAGYAFKACVLNLPDSSFPIDIVFGSVKRVLWRSKISVMSDVRWTHNRSVGFGLQLP